MVYTSKKRPVFLDAVQNLMSTSKKRGYFLEAGSQTEGHLSRTSRTGPSHMWLHASHHRHENSGKSDLIRPRRGLP